MSTFLAVVRNGSMRRAAVGLHVTQPAVSARIRELERRLEVRLFERHGRALIPTEAGRIVATEATALVGAAEALHRRLAELQSGAAGTLRIATLDAASIYVLPSTYLEYRRDAPRVQLTVQVVDSRRVLGLVADLEVDVGVLALPASHPEVTLRPFFRDELACIAAPGHALAQSNRVRLRDLTSQPLVLYGRGSTTRAVLDAMFQSQGLVPNVAMETASPEAMKRLVEVGVGLAIVPRALVRDEVAAGRLVEIVVADARFTRTLAVALRRGRRLPPAAQRFVALLEARFPSLAAPAGRGKRSRGNATGRTRKGAPRAVPRRAVRR